MSGRSAFSKAKPVIDAIRRINRLVPAPLFKATWFVVRDAPGLPGIVLRYFFVARLAKACGDNVMIGRGCEIREWAHLSLGSNVTIHLHGYIDASGGLSVGDNVSIAHNVSILTFEHGWDDLSLPIKYNPLKLAPVTIADDVWIGCGVRVLAGAHIDSRVICAAGSIVTRGNYNSGIYGGVPAKKIREI